jgi:hypothetical protein
MRDGVHKKCGSSDGKAWALIKLFQILWHNGLTLLEVLKEPESDCGGDMSADLRDFVGQ